MRHYSATGGSELYLDLLDDLLQAPETAPRGLKTKELRDVTVEILEPTLVHALYTERRPNLKIAAVEAWHLIAGVSSLWQLNQVSGGRFNQFADQDRLRGAYGPRTYGNLIAVFEKLRKDPDTRQAYVPVWDGFEFNEESHDTPCTTGFQFFLRDGKLDLRVTMRSNDAWLGWPIDVMMFSCLHRTMAAALEVDPGSYTHSVGSMHLYEPQYGDAARIIESGITNAWGAAAVETGIPIPEAQYGWKNPWLARQKFAETMLLRVTDDLDNIFDGTPTGWVLSRLPHLLSKPVNQGLCLGCRYVDVMPCDECDGEA